RQLGQELGRLAERGGPGAERLVQQRGIPHRDAPPRAGRGVAVDQSEVLETGEALGQLDWVGDGGRGEQEARNRAVGGRQAAQARAGGRRPGSPSPARARAWSCARALVGYRYSARARGSVHSTSSVGRLKHNDLPEAVPVVTTTGPSAAASSASAWCA